MADGWQLLASPDPAAAGCKDWSAFLLHAPRPDFMQQGASCFLARRAPGLETSWPPLTIVIHVQSCACLCVCTVVSLRNELVLVDAPFTDIGDDVTVDYDGQVRCHSFEERCSMGLCLPSAICQLHCTCKFYRPTGLAGLLHLH